MQDVTHQSRAQGSLAPLPLASALLLFLLALVPRLIGLGEAVTEDEDQWIGRSANFARAMSTGAWRNTYQIGHPGVTTMWVTSLALGPERAIPFAEAERGGRLVTQVEGFLPALRAARVPFALLNAALALVCALLAWRIFGPGAALLGGLLLALDPYWSAMSPIVGMDGLLAGLTAASLLAAVLAFQPLAGGWRWALLSGLAAGLALLTKGPAILLLPVMPLIALSGGGSVPGGPMRSTLARLAIWGLALAATAVIWPAMWTDPLGTVRRTAEFVRGIGTSPHGPGNFFLGQPIADPGPLFYPVALGLRLAPATLVGLVLLVIFRVPAHWRGPIALLAAYLAIFFLGLTLAAKKIDRYLLPLFPILGLLAGLGWWLALNEVTRRLRRPLVAPLVVLLIGLLQVWPLAIAGRHPLAAYNPFYGGIQNAERSIPIGWGEGLDSVGDYLWTQPGADQLVTAVWFPLYVNFQAHAPGRVVNITFSGPNQVANQGLLDQAHFYVDYIHARQRRLTPRELLNRQPDFVANINGVEYARLYRLR